VILPLQQGFLGRCTRIRCCTAQGAKANASTVDRSNVLVHNNYYESSLAQDQSSLILKIFCTKYQHDNYLHFTQNTIKTKL
jgi:hypothetical protein